MTLGYEGAETVPIRVLVAGSSPWVRAASGAVDECERTSVANDVEIGDDDWLEAADCVLTDDPSVCASVGGERPVLCAVGDETTDLRTALDAGATDVVERTATDRPALLEHRLRRLFQEPSGSTSAGNETQYRSLLEHSPESVLHLDTSGRITDGTPAVERLLGSPSAELEGKRLFDDVHEADRGAVIETFERVRDGESGASEIVTYRHPEDGSWRVHEAVLTNRLADPDVNGLLVSIRDVTRHYRVDRETIASFERVTDAFYALDTDWTFTYVNARAEELFGYSRAELLGNDAREIFPHGCRSDLYDRFEEALSRQEPLSWERYSESLGIWMEIHVYPSETGLSVYFRDITERIEQKRKLAERTERLQMLVEHAPVIHYVLDDEGTITLLEGRGLENIGLEPSETVGESFFAVVEDYPEIRADARAAVDGQSVHSQRRILDRVFEAWYQPVVEDDEVVRVIGIAVDVTERVQYQEALNTLHEATSHLLTVESKQAACEYIVGVADDVLDTESIVFRFDEQDNELVPAAYSDSLEREVGPPPRFGPDDSITWDAFVSGSQVVFDDVRDSELVYEETTEIRSGLYVPLGEHGVLAAVSTAVGRYGEETAELARLFAMTAEAALDRIEQTRRLHERERALEEQNAHLERLNRANRIRQEIEEHLLLADSREAIEQGICERLVEQETCLFAWIGEPDPSGSRIQPRTSAGVGRDYLETVPVTTADDDATEPTGQTVRSRSPIYVENIAANVHDGAWRGDALSRSFQSVYAVPLVYDGYLYGVLSIYGNDPGAFCETFRTMLADLGETVAYAIDAVKRKNASLETGVTELELELTTDSPLCLLANRLDARVSYEGATLQADGSTLVFVAIEPSADEREIDATIADIDGIDDPLVLAETEAQTQVQLRLTGPFLGRIVSDHGGTVRSVVCADDESRAVVVVPDSVEVRELLAEINRRGRTVSMTARRERSAADASTLDAPARNALFEQLTPRQREVVRTAYYGGFFDWPRRTTGEEIAGTLEISSTAFHKHVRAVERKLFTALFEGGDGG
jgi:HTH-type transcriptional regulator, bacterioopsin transcriptional activator and related proteins